MLLAARVSMTASTASNWGAFYYSSVAYLPEVAASTTRHCETLPLFTLYYDFPLLCADINHFSPFQDDVGCIVDCCSTPSAVRKSLISEDMLWLLAAGECKEQGKLRPWSCPDPQLAFTSKST